MAKANKHLDHLEDLIIIDGAAGARKAIEVLKEVGSVLSPGGGAPMTITTKWDGAPAVICGIDPADGKFFVGTKGVFAKEPKMAKTQSDVQRLYSGGLASKMSDCLKYLRNTVTTGVLQGDLLFTDDKKTETIDGKSYITFRPNTLTYAVDPSSPVGRKVSGANIGIVFHTKYTGPSIQEMSASFGVNDSDYNVSSSVWAVSASFQNVGGVATFSQSEYVAYNNAIRQAEGSILQAGSVFNDIQSGKKALQIDTIFLQFFNSYYRKGSPVPSVNQTYNEFVRYLAGQYNTAISKNKTLDAQADKAFKFVGAIDYIHDHQRQFTMLIASYLNLTRAKMMLVGKMNQVAALQAFVDTGNGYKVTNQEGFVAVSTDRAVKLIDRLEFSMLNFTVPKIW